MQNVNVLAELECLKFLNSSSNIQKKNYRPINSIEMSQSTQCIFLKGSLRCSFKSLKLLSLRKSVKFHILQVPIQWQLYVSGKKEKMVVKWGNCHYADKRVAENQRKIT